MIKPELPVWLNRGEIIKLKRAAGHWWKQVQQWLEWINGQHNALTCSDGLLQLLAWQRGIDRFDGEPLTLFRLRTHYAFINARDAGSVAGLQNIFLRLGIGHVDIVERQDSAEWDVLTLWISDSQLSRNTRLLQVLLTMYGRTCRRYRFETLVPVSINVRGVDLAADYQCYRASYRDEE